MAEQNTERVLPAWTAQLLARGGLQAVVLRVEALEAALVAAAEQLESIEDWDINQPARLAAELRAFARRP